MQERFQENPEKGKRIEETLTLNEYPSLHSEVYHTNEGTPYLKEAGVVLTSAPAVNLQGMSGFLEGFESDYKFSNYLNDPGILPPGEAIVKAAGQVCYASYGPQRTHNEDAARYIENLLSSGHGSVLEHANYSVLMYGVSRSLTHELVRHRAGMAFSQLSQRYVSGKVLRFVERKEFQKNEELHNTFEARIDRAAKEYESLSEILLRNQEAGDGTLTAESRTDRRKKVQQTARALLPNETETVIMITGNARAWRHVLNQRGSEHAETEIRDVTFRTYLLLLQSAPLLFGDFEPYQLDDGSFALKTPYPKV